MKKTHPQHPPTIFVYINDIAAFYSPGKVMFNFISKSLNAISWRHTSDLHTFPKIIRELSDGNAVDGGSFTMGFCTAQWSMARNGIFINPCIAGLMDDPKIWEAVIQDSDHIDKIIYLDVPYSIYLAAAAENPGMMLEDEDEYEDLSLLTEGMVGALVAAAGITFSSETHH